ncbi:LPD5 domain-containing protein [Akkermansia sp.]|uniref:LPD5 domain-containing protein n=1 Tax=Akkermansia sp. TaxID=1872421 RepID=UPI0025B97E43|nr:LPD5 domain-containing protein [Akkermansia sp.]
MNFEEYFQRIGQAEQSVNELNQPAGDGMASSLPDYMPGIETTAEEHAPGWMRPALNAVRPEWEEKRNRWEELGAAALYGDFLKTGQQGELDARVQEVIGKNKVFRDFIEEGDKPLSRMYMGREVMRALYGSRFRDVPEMYFHSRGEQMPENGRKSLNDGYAAVWDDFSGKTRKRYADYQQKKAEFQRGLEEFGNELGTALPEAVLTGKPLTPDMMEKATRYGQAERVTASLQRARAAVDLLRGVNRGGVSHGNHEGAVKAETERILQEENKEGTSYRFLGMEFGKPKTEEEAKQQARANLGNSYEVTREFISHLVNVLSDEDGQLDKGALGAMMLALDADAQGQQTIDARFLRNMGEALKRWWMESDDFLRRYTKKDPFNEFLDVRNALTDGESLTLEGYLADRQQEEETHRRLYEDPRVEKLKSALSRIEDTRLSAADKAGFLAGSLTELGTITGDSAPAVLAGFVSGGLSIAAFAPASMNRSIAQAHVEDRQNAELYGLITGGFEALAEGSFGVAVRKVPFVGKLMDKAAMGLIGKPVVGKAAATVQSNWFLRYLGDRVVAESFGELVGEEVISQTGSYLTIQGLRGLGVDMDAPEWMPFSTAWENIQDERQSAATVAYCAALGLMGLSADTRAAREFSRSRENLMTIGLTPETATKLAAMTEEAMNQAALLQAGGDLNASKLRELDDKLQTEYRDAYQKEVVNEDPVKLRDRLKKNHDLFMNDIDAQVALKEGVLKAALREQGVLDVEESLTGKNVVTVEDAEQAEKDRASWQDGKMPEGYETPVKKVEWTDEQLAAYSQYAIGNEGLKRMKAIRSAALNLDMAAKVDEKDYAKTLPLTESAVPVAAELARSKGAITIDALRALSEAAAKEGETGRNVLPGVSNAAVGAMEDSFVMRLQWEARSGNTAGASRLLAGEGGAAAIRLTAGEGPASRILYNPGHTLSTNLTEDVVESMLVDKLRKEGGMDNQGVLTDAGKDWLAAMHRDMQAVRRQVLAATGKDIMPGLDKAEPSLMNIAEYFSHLSQSAFYQNAQQYGLNDAAMRHVQFMDSALLQTKFLNDMGAGFAKWADTEAGRAWQKEGGTLAGLLRESGHELADLYTSSRVTAENVAAVEEARRYRRANGTRTVEDIRAELEAAAQEETPVTPESELEARQPREIPAEESITGEAIPAEANEEVPDTDPESGEFVPPPGSVIETDPEGKGRGLEGGRYAEDSVEGSVIGMVPFASLEFTELPYAGYMAADGMAEVLRHTDGRMEVIMGGALLRQEQRSMKVRVWDADATRNEAWARGRALEQMALAGLAPKAFSVRDYLEYYRHLYPAGLPDRSALGKLGKKAQQAVTILEKAAPDLVQDVLSGTVSAADAYAAVETAATQDGQRFFINQKAADKKTSLEYLTALTRAYEAAPGADAGTLQHQARYTVAARKEIRKAVSRLRDVRGEKPRAVAQRELGINLPTADAVADAITRLGLLDASFDAFESDLDIPGHAAEWDGKSPVRVVADFMQAREEVKEMKAGTEAAEAASRTAQERARNEEKDEALMERARKLELPAAKRWMKPRAVPLAGAQAQEAIVKALELLLLKDGARYVLNGILHEVRDGRECFVGTDGKSIAIVSRIAPPEVVEGTRELLGKANLPATMAAGYPDWRQVVPAAGAPGTRTDMVDLARFNFLEGAKSGKDEFGKVTYRTQDGQRIGLAHHGKVSILNPNYISILLKQTKMLHRELGMPALAEVTCPPVPYNPVRFDVTFGDWTFTSCTMPIQNDDTTLQTGDIILNAYEEQASTRETQQDTREEQKRQPSRPKAEQTEAPAKLDDAGREIKAHKSRYRDRITEPLKAEMPEDFSKVTVGKYFPEPDWQQLVNDGVSQDVIVAVALIRNLLPDKPRGRKVFLYGQKWLEAMKMYRSSTAELLEGSLKPEEFFAMLANQDEKWARQVDLFRGLGYPYCLQAMGMQLSTWTSYPDRTVKWCVESRLKGRAVISGYYGDGRMYDTKEEAIEAFRVVAGVQAALEDSAKQKQGEDGKSEKKRKDVKLTIRYYNSGPKQGEYFICRDLPGSARIKLKEGLASGKEARDYMNAHMDELQEKLRGIAKKPDVMLEVSSERVGEDYRNGKNVDNAMLMETFGVNGITYGNWVSGPERQAKLNATHDAFLDLANLLGIPPRVISLNGSLGFQFGASGTGEHAAHYRLNDVSINLTRKKGDGTLAHEWWHALDHYFMRAHAGMDMEMGSDHARSRITPGSARRVETGGIRYDYQHSTPGMNEDAGRVFAELVHAIKRSKYADRSAAMGRKYWGSNVEMTARAFQAYIVRKARNAGILNEYLSAYQSKEVFSEIDRAFFESTGIDRYPYPTDEEMEKFAPLFDRFFAALTHTKQDNGNYVTFSVTAPEEDKGGTQMDTPAETTFSVTALDGNGTILKSEAFIARPDGNPDWFTIPKRKGQPSMPVRLLVGEDTAFHKGYGLTHIAASRDSDGLWERFTPERYLSSVLSNVSELWEISPGRELLVKGKRPSSWMILQLVKEDGYYSIVSAYPVEQGKKPKGKKLPLAERASGENQREARHRQPSTNPDAVPGAFPGGQESETATLASTAGGGDVSSLPPGARVVNINDVRLRFDDGRQMQAGSPVSTMSLALMDDGLDSAPHLKERVVQQLIGDVRTAVRRFNRVFAGATNTESAARELGQAQALLGMINKYAAKGYRPRLAAQMHYVEVYARMLESGKILSYGKLSAHELESLKEDLEADLADAVEVSALGTAWETATGMEVEGELKNERMLLGHEKKARQEVRDTLVRDYAGRKLDEVVRDMLNQGAAQLEKQLKDEEIARIGSLLDFLRPRKDAKTGKLKKGLMNADAYRRVARITRMMEATPEEKSAQMEAINNRLAPHGEGDKAVTLEEAELDRLSLELLDWSAYGALESMSLDAVRAAGESLRELVLVERNAWESRLEDEKKRLKRVAQDAVRAMGEADATEMRMMSEADLKTRRLFGMMAENVMSFSQAMYAMSGMPGMKGIAGETLDALANGHIELTAKEREINNQLEKFLKDELGLTTERQRADFVQGLKRTRQTNIVRKKVATHSLDLTVEEAQRWLSMSKEERQAERDRLREEAENKGWSTEDIVEEDDLLPLKDALHAALNPPLRIDGKKGKKRSRVQVSREYLKEQKPIIASADQMLNAILTYEQPFYEENARINGYTSEVLDALRREVGADALAYGYKMRDLLSESGVAEEFERREGVPFPLQENYWPGRFRDSSRINQDRDAMDAERGTGTRYGMLIQRVSHKDEVNLSMGASNVFLFACAQQNNYLVMGRMTTKWRRLLADRKFANALNQKLGDNRFQAIKQMLDLLDGAGVVEAVTQRSLSSLVSMCQSAHAVSVLSLALTTIAKQPSALMHASAFKSPSRVIKQLILDRMGRGKIRYRDMLHLSAFQARYRDDRQFAELMRKGSDATWTRLASLSRFGMSAIEHMDVWSNCASMTALYNLTWQDLEANNRGSAEPMTEEQMEEICEQAVKNALELVGQPQRLTQRSMMAALGKNNIWVKTSGYMGSEMLNKVGMAVAIGEKSRAEGESAVKRLGKKLLWISTMSSVEQVILMLLDLMRGNGPDDDELPEWLVYNAITGLSGLGLLNTLPILGPTLEEVSGQLNKLITGNGKGFIKTGLLDDMLFNLGGWMRCVKKFKNTDKLSGEEMALAIADTIRLGAAGTGLGRGVNSTMQWTSTLSGILQSCSAAGNMVRPFLQRIINEEKKEKKERRERTRR